jgi:hypothetical protein
MFGMEQVNTHYAMPACCQVSWAHQAGDSGVLCGCHLQVAGEN